MKIGTIKDCDVYLSVVHDLRLGSDSMLHFEELDLKWLMLSNSGNSVKDGRYFLVFEEYGPRAEEFRIRSSDASAYFAAGFPLTVAADGSVNAEAVRREYEKREQDMARLIPTAGAAVPCYTFKKLTAELQQQHELAAASLELCSAAADL
jgi:hypothetical protein